MKARKKPVTIEFEQLTRENWNAVCEFITLPWGDDGVHEVYSNNGVASDIGERIGLIIPTLEGDMLAVENDYIIKGIQGEFYPCKPDIFEASYELVD